MPAGGSDSEGGCSSEADRAAAEAVAKNAAQAAAMVDQLGQVHLLTPSEARLLDKTPFPTGEAERRFAGLSKKLGEACTKAESLEVRLNSNAAGLALLRDTEVPNVRQELQAALARVTHLERELIEVRQQQQQRGSAVPTFGDEQAIDDSLDRGRREASERAAAAEAQREARRADILRELAELNAQGAARDAMDHDRQSDHAPSDPPPSDGNGGGGSGGGGSEGGGTGVVEPRFPAVPCDAGCEWKLNRDNVYQGYNPASKNYVDLFASDVDELQFNHQQAGNGRAGPGGNRASGGRGGGGGRSRGGGSGRGGGRTGGRGGGNDHGGDGYGGGRGGGRGCNRDGGDHKRQKVDFTPCPLPGHTGHSKERCHMLMAAMAAAEETVVKLANRKG